MIIHFNMFLYVLPKLLFRPLTMELKQVILIDKSISTRVVSELLHNPKTYLWHHNFLGVFQNHNTSIIKV